jgi:hypothetical protein
MFVFGNDKKMRGCFATFNLFTAGGRGARMVLPSGIDWPGELLADGPGATAATQQDDIDPIIITGMSYGQKEKYHLVQCFSDYTYTYAFGHDPQASLLEVQFVSFLVASDGEKWSDIPVLFNKHYKKNRLIESLSYAKVFLGTTEPMSGFIVGMQSSTADAHHNLQNFSMTLLLAEAQGPS